MTDLGVNMFSSPRYTFEHRATFCTTMACQGEEGTPLPYTASPIKLLWGDVCLFFSLIKHLPGIFMPLELGYTGPLDEFYPSAKNIVIIGIHVFLAVYQVIFLVSVPLMIICMIPGLWILAYLVIGLGFNYGVVMLMLNGSEQILVSQVPEAERPGHDRECWLYINGIAAGHRWVQMNIDQLSHTFGRKVTGVHNRT